MIPLLLGRGVDVGQIIGILFLVISVLRWFVNLIQGNTPDGNPRQQKPKPKPQSSQSEIESLLKELSGNKPRPQPSKPQPQQRIETQQRPQKPSTDRSRPKQPPAKPKQIAQQAAPAARVADSKLPSANLGAGVRTSQLGNRVEAAVVRDVDEPVQHDLGNRIAAAAPPQEKTIHPLVKILRDPNGVRQAILLNEILQRPNSARRSR